jgi:hypothetical protein
LDLVKSGRGQRRILVQEIDDIEAQGRTRAAAVPASVQVGRGEGGDAAGWIEVGIGIGVGEIDGAVNAEGGVRPAGTGAQTKFEWFGVSVGTVNADAGVAEGVVDFLDVGGVEVEEQLIGVIQLEKGVRSEYRRVQFGRV